MNKKNKFLWIGITTLAVTFFAWQFISATPSKPSAGSELIKKVSNEQEFSAIINNAGTKLIVLDLYADWCGPCRMLHPTLVSLARKYAGQVAFYQINVDENPGIASALGTNGIPYVVFVKYKKALTSITGLNPAESYEKIISNYSSNQGTQGKTLEKL